MNRQYAEKIISALKDDLENDYNGFELVDDMSRAEKLFGKEIPAIVDCTEESRSHSGTIRRNAQIIVDLLEIELAEQKAIVDNGLTQIEKGAFLKLFNRGGYVLNFTTNDFDVFTMESVGVALCAKYGFSKGKSLTEYITKGADEKEALKLLKDLLDYYKENYEQEYIYSEDEDVFGCSRYNAEYARLYNKCRAYMDRVLNVTTPLATNATELQEKFSSEYLSKQIELMIKMQTENPTDAIGKAKELIESCCKTILDNEGTVWDKNWNMSKLTGETLKLLNLTPENIPSSDPVAENIKAVLGNLRGITTKLAEIRNPYGSGHGKSASFTGLETRHAKLAVGCSITFVTFLWDTYEGGLTN